ncbi:anthranilate synthase component I family protein [Fulvivirga ulvae]|uniref:anthranilate synthase component I family protein n=1 Tax=Fulvivirga ulvae TaxID=2904245 RepID=UPI001F29DAC6|nr:anthranilate synthase component I family protein [Fulvivirga ulvae]UII31554.1 anthranilate synthase component I family protein [Fulvivirga ulvae]
MRKHSFRYVLENPETFRKNALVWASSFSHCTYFNNNNILKYPYGPFDNMLTVGAQRIISFGHKNSFEELKQHYKTRPDWMIGYLAYDLKNQTEVLQSNNPDHMGFPDIYFYIPEHILFFKGSSLYIESNIAPDRLMEEIYYTESKKPAKFKEPVLKQNTSRDEYIKTVNKLKNHIIEGDIYEINYCMEFSGSDGEINPLATYLQLVDLSPTPFSVYHQFENRYLICASPERFLKKQTEKLISQPIKGTARRGSSSYEDEIIKQQLRTDEKELAENMMIVDLVRNDLAKSSKTGTVKVDEMFGIYTFKQLHQMISTVTSELRNDVHFIDAIKNAFPMGSMTGAPKVKVMQLIEQYEQAKRGLYSGAMGYITPSGDFDFNVVIRSLLYHAVTKKISFQVGSAITYDSDPEREYDECLLKAKAIIQTLSSQG